MAMKFSATCGTAGNVSMSAIGVFRIASLAMVPARCMSIRKMIQIMTGNPAPRVGAKGLDQNSEVFCGAGDTIFPALVNQFGPDRLGARFLLVSIMRPGPRCRKQNRYQNANPGDRSGANFDT